MPKKSTAHLPSLEDQVWAAKILNAGRLTDGLRPVASSEVTEKDVGRVAAMMAEGKYLEEQSIRPTVTGEQEIPDQVSVDAVLLLMLSRESPRSGSAKIRKSARHQVKKRGPKKGREI